MKKVQKILSVLLSMLIFVSISVTTPSDINAANLADDIYTVVGNSISHYADEGEVFGTIWDVYNENNRMFWNGKTYEKTFTVKQPSTEIQLKVVKNADNWNDIEWIGNSDRINVIFDMSLPGEFTVLFNPSTNKISIVIGGLEYESTADGLKPVNSSDKGNSENIDSISVGDYITLGNYLGESIVWRCVAIDENGPLMLSDKILCYKAFDGKGDDSTYHNDGWGYIRKSYGSNCWYDSNIRQWLNSTKEKVEWTHCPPNASNVNNGKNTYDNEKGFCANFTSAELQNIKTSNNIININEWERSRDGYCDGGVKEIDCDSILNYTTTTDFTSFYYQVISDKFFLLTAKQIAEINEVLPEALFTIPTDSAINYNQDNSINDCNSYWLSVPGTNGASYEHVQTIPYGNGGRGAFINNGIRPAFYLNTKAYKENGENSQEQPTTVAPATTIKYGADRFSYGKDMTGYVGETLKSTLLLISNVYDTTDLTYTSSNKNIADILYVDHGHGEEVSLDENTHTAMVYLDLKSEGTTTITITAPDGTSSSVTLFVQNIDKFNYNSGFTLGKDNNAFCHYNLQYESESGKTPVPGFLGVEKYSIPVRYYNKLVKNTTFSEKIAVIKAANSNWGGSCYGIAATMCLNYATDINLNSLIENTNTYWELGLPYKNSDFLNTINYYQLSQQIKNYGTNSTYYFCDLYNSGRNGYSKSGFLKKMVEVCSNKETTILGMLVGNSGHAIVACGYYYDKINKKHIIRLYDENSVTWREDSGEYSYMCISDDFSEFTIKGDVSEDISEIKTMFLVDITGNSNLENPVNLSKSLFSTGDQSKKMYVTVDATASFKITNDKGQSLSYDGTYYSGDMEIYNIQPIYNLENSQYIYELDYSGNVTYTSTDESITFKVYDDENYYSLSGENIESSNIDFEKGITLTGDNYVFNVAVGRDNNDDAEIISVSGDGSNTTNINVDEDNNVVMKSDSTVSDLNVEVITIEENKTIIENVDADSFELSEDNDITLNAIEPTENTTATESTESTTGTDNTQNKLIGDVNLDGTVDVKDVTYIQKHLASLIFLNDYQLARADTNNDGIINIKDATTIQLFLLQFITNLG